MEELRKMNIPVLLITWRRENTLDLQIDILRDAKIKKLFIFNDGPKNLNQKTELSNFRKKIRSAVDWECEVFFNFQQKNLGVKHGPKKAIDWFFMSVDEGIILEDDVMPHLSFFNFCRVLLTKYSSDDRIGLISSITNNKNIATYGGTYGYSRFPHIWGWATWKKEWLTYSDNFEFWENIKNKHFIIQETYDFSRYWSNCFDGVLKNEIIAWDYCWAYSQIMQNKLTIIPQESLSKSVGRDSLASTSAGGESTSTFLGKEFEVVHPKLMYPDDTVEHPHPFNTLNELTSKRNILGMVRKKLVDLIYAVDGS